MKLFISLILLITASPLWSADRVALVVGNSDYQKAKDLPNARQDSLAVAKMLAAAGFEVISGPKGVTDATVDTFYAKLEEFKTAARGAKVGLIYYAGHGVEVDGKNYLLPVDATLDQSSQLRTQAVSVDTLLAEMKDARLPAKLLILDCCRDNPLTRSWLNTRSNATGGLAELKEDALPESTMIMFSTAPGKTALDGTGQNSPFTAALLQHLPAPGATAFDAFLQVSDAVAKETGEQQVPWIKFDGAGRTFRQMSLSTNVVARPLVPSVPLVPLVPEAGGGPFTNSLGMKFVSVPGTNAQMCIHETRRKDYEAYAAAKSGVDGEWRAPEQEGVKLPTEGEHPVVNVSWEDAKGFCEWLSRKEGRTYRLPSDREWSVAVGIGGQESATATPKDLGGKIKEVYPWGGSFTASSINGNYCGQETKGKFFGMIEGYRDGYETTAPVMQFRANKLGIYDLGGNVWEWCEDWYDTDESARVLRGGSWYDNTSVRCSSACRSGVHPNSRGALNGFRVVLVVAGGG